MYITPVACFQAILTSNQFFFNIIFFCNTQFSVVKLYNLEFCRKSKHDIRFLSNFISYIIYAGPVCVNISLSLVLNEYKEKL